MNKYLLMSAAAVLAGTAVSAAASEPKKVSTGTQSFYLTAATSMGGQATYCDALQVHWSGLIGNILVDVEAPTLCGTGNTALGVGFGIAGKNKDYSGLVSADSDSIAGSEYEQVNLGLEMSKQGAPINGGKWGEVVTMVTTMGGVDAAEVAYGLYHFGAPRKHVSGKHLSLTGNVKTAGTHAPLVKGLTVKE